MQPKTQRIIGWVLTILVAVFLGGLSAPGKFTDFPKKEEMFKKLEFPAEAATTVGILEVAFAILLVIPQTGFLGAILLTGYLGGAFWTHLRVNDPNPFSIIIGVIMWVGIGFRYPGVFSLAMGKAPEAPKSPN